MSGIKRYLSDNAYKAAEHSESPSESNPFVTLTETRNNINDLANL